jgi:urea transporter
MAHVKPAVAMIDILLRGVGQVMFQNNPITELLILAGIGINSYKYSVTVLLGLIVATLAAYLLGADRTLIRNGLFGFNGVLTGIALSVFLQWDWHVAVYIILGAIVSTIAMLDERRSMSCDGHVSGQLLAAGSAPHHQNIDPFRLILSHCPTLLFRYLAC